MLFVFIPEVVKKITLEVKSKVWIFTYVKIQRKMGGGHLITKNNNKNNNKPLQVSLLDLFTIF